MRLSFLENNHYILYGLTPNELNEVVFIYAMMKKDDSEKLNEQAIRLNKIVSISFEKSRKIYRGGSPVLSVE